ncbi:MAG: tetratricopeptide repeat protein [Acidobacteriota bacterium]|nr:tetratricopeptide repeat protein [Acidobacteriota bacterium]
MRPAARVAIVAVAGIAALVALYRWVYVPNSCNAQLTYVTNHSLSTDDVQDQLVAVRAAQENLAILATLAERCPTDVRVPMLQAFNQHVLGHREEAIASYRRALHFQNRPEIYVAIGDMYFELGRLDDALENYTHAVRYSTTAASMIVSDEMRQETMERVRGKR